MKILDENWTKALGREIYKGYSPITVFLPFKEAREVVRRLKLKSNKEWRKYCKSGKKPDNIPFSPEKFYKNNKEWISYGNWLGNRNVHTKDFLLFNEARKIVRLLGLKSRTEWRKYRSSGKRPDNIPSDPDQVYINKGWIGFKDWLGY